MLLVSLTDLLTNTQLKRFIESQQGGGGGGQCLNCAGTDHLTYISLTYEGSLEDVCVKLK